MTARWTTDKVEILARNLDSLHFVKPGMDFVTFPSAGGRITDMQMDTQFEWKKFLKPVKIWRKPWTWFKRAPRKVIPVMGYTTIVGLRPLPFPSSLSEEMRERVVKAMQYREENGLFYGSHSPFYDSACKTQGGHNG